MDNSTGSEKPWYTPAFFAFLCEDVPALLGISSKCMLLDIITIERRLTAEGESFLTKTLPAFGKAIDLALGGNQPLTTASFKKKGRSALPAFLQALLRLVFTDDGWLRNEPSYPAIRLLRQTCYWFKKIKKGFTDESLRKATADFISVDRALPSDGDFGAVANGLLDSARAVIDWVLRDIAIPVDARPKHGPGAVAGGGGAIGKRIWNTRYVELERYFRPLHWFFSLRDAAEDPSRIYGRVVRQYGIDKITFVEKDSSGPRTIGITPNAYMWCQQAVKDLLVHHLECVSRWRGQINFTDQTINREFARLWWIYDTLDMSKASDRNSLALVCNLLKNQELLPWLLACRTHGAILPDGRYHEYKKFAPMGSATCFPVQALVYYSLACAALHREGMPLLLAMKKVYVYGDDLIVPTGYFTAVNNAFESVGLKFNMSKCCVEGKFRESCGLDAYDGFDVTPVRLKTAYVTNQSDLAKLVQHSNMLYDAGYRNAALEFKAAALSSYPHLRKLRVPHSHRVLPILTWRSLPHEESVRYKTTDSITRVTGWCYRALKCDAPTALEGACYQEALATGGAVGNLAFSKPRSIDAKRIGRTFDKKYAGDLVRKTIAVNRECARCAEGNDPSAKVVRLYIEREGQLH